MIRIESLRFRSLLIDSLSLEQGITSVIGPNGSGKTTALKLCAGILLPEFGTVLIDKTEPRRTEIGWVNEFPDRNFLFETTGDEIASPLRFQHLPPGEIVRRMDEIHDCFGLAGLDDRPIRELSGGEKILVALAAAIITKPRVLILDEFDSHLDARTAGRIDRILRNLQIPFILKSTQDMENAAGSDYVVFLNRGRVEYAGTPGEVFTSLRNTPFYPLSWRCRP
jgi:energy-coupling factor transport system ATP-binding protein